MAAWHRAEATAGLGVAALSAQAQGARVQAAQVAIEPRIAALGGRVVYSVQRVLNGQAVVIPAGRVADLESLPGVRAVRPIGRHRPANAEGVSLIGAPQLWAGLGGLPVRGEKIKVGIIDTGVDYLHADFGGSGLASDYARNDTTVITDSVGLPSAKVVGGWDFAGDDYNGTGVPRSDPDPMDCASGSGLGGHGTHVAGTAAGYGVNADGTTYQGPWDAAGVPTTTMRIGPGSAPLADILALKVFGCQGGTALVAQAIEWSVDPNGDFDLADRLDVINLSLGGAYGSAQQDVSSDAADAAALAGVIVVAAAGNNADTFMIGASPAAADRAISVAASNAGGTALPDLLRINAPAGIAGQITAVPAQFGTPITGTFALTADLVLTQPALACTPLTNATTVSGKIAVIDRGECSFALKVKQAEVAGAVAAIVVDNLTEVDPFAMFGDTGVTVTLPAVMIRQFDGEVIKATLEISRVNGTIDARLGESGVTLRDTLGTFTSRGPGRGATSLKPDVSAPGVEVFSASSRTGSDGTRMSGTSMAAPMVAGSMALLRQLHPDWTVEELKALLMNTAGIQTRTSDGRPYSPSRQGAGRIDLPAAARAQAVAYDAARPGAVSLSFGSLQVATSAVLTRTLRVFNKAATPANYSLGVDLVAPLSGVAITPLSSAVTVPAGGSVTVPVRLSVDAALLKRTLDLGTAPTQNGQPRDFLSEVAGSVVLSGPDQLRVPFYADVRPATAMHAQAEEFRTGSGLTSTVATLIGTTVPATTGYDPLVWALELQQISPENSYTKTVGLQKAGDLKYVGVGTDFAPGANPADATIYFGLATYAPMSSGANDVTFEISIDTNLDGTPDYRVSNATYGPTQVNALLSGDDVFIANLASVSGTATTPVGWTYLNGFSATISTAPYSSTVMVLPVKARDLKLQPGQSRFSYQVKAYQQQFSGGTSPTDVSERLTYDPVQPGLRVAGGLRSAPVFTDTPGTTIQVTVDPVAAALSKAKGLLLLHHFNTSGSQADVLGVALETYLPFIGRTAP